MGQILAVVDGMTDEKYSFPLSGAILNRAAGEGTVSVCPPDTSPDSLPCILTLLGVPARQLPRGRAHIEALAEGLPCAPADLWLRCNAADLTGDGVLRAPSAPAQGLLACGRSCLARGAPGEEEALYHTEGYRFLLRLPGLGAQAAGTKTFPPHQNVGRAVKTLLPRGTPAGERAAAFARCACIRERDGARMLLPWDASAVQEIPAFETLHGVRGAAVCAAGVVRGIAAAMALDAPGVSGATGDVDTALEEKLRQTLRLKNEYAFVLLHVNGADEAAHRRDAAQKARFLRRVEGELLAPLLDALEPGEHLLLCADHGTSPVTGAHLAGAQRALLFAPGTQGAREDLGALPGRAAVPLLLKGGAGAGTE